MGGSYSSTEPTIPKAAQEAWGGLKDETANLQAKVKGGQYPTGTFRPTYNPQLYTGMGTQQYSGPATQGYAGPLTTSMSPQQTMGLDQIQSWAMNPSGLENSGTDLLNKTLQGQFLDPASNPYLQKSADAMSANMSKAIGANSQDLSDVFSKMGVSYRGPAEQKMRTAALSDFANSMTGMYGNAYNSERGNQMNALGQAQSWANMPGQRGAALMSAGAVPTALDQQNNQNMYNAWSNMANNQMGAFNNAASANQNAFNNYQGAQSGQQTFDYNNFLQNLTNNQTAFMLPWQLQNSMLGSMPLAYPQQQYNKGFLDYANDTISAVGSVIPG